MINMTISHNLILKITLLIEKGNFPHSAAQHEGVEPRLFDVWMRIGRTITETPSMKEEDLSDYQYLCLKLFRQVEQANARNEAGLLGEIVDIAEADRDGKLLMSILERRHRENWSRESRLKIKGTVTTVSPVSQEEVLRAESSGKDLNDIYKSMIATEAVQND